jgi:hypothetical protein
MLEPSRSTYEFVANPEITVDIPGDPDMLLVDLAGTNPARVGLYQYYPARTLIRWIEAEHGEGRWLAIPLAGLVSGEYWITSAPADAAAGPREMDLPAEQLDRIGAFRLE